MFQFYVCVFFSLKLLFFRTSNKKVVVYRLCVITEMSHARCVTTLYIQGVNISSYIHNMCKCQISVAFAFGVKKYLFLGNEATETFLSSLLSRVYVPVWSPAGISNIRDYSLSRAERGVKILLFAYKGVNTVWLWLFHVFTWCSACGFLH